jgi:hypothetical protein
MIAKRIQALGEIGFCHCIPAVIFLLVSVLTLQEYGRNFTCDCKIMIGRVISGLSYNITERNSIILLLSGYRTHHVDVCMV